MDQQGLPSPLSNSSGSSVINTSYCSDSSVNYQRKHSFQHVDDFDSGIDLASERIQKISEDECKEDLSGLELQSPSDGLKYKRYNKTAEALKMSGLMDITMKTADLLKKNKQLEIEIDLLKKDSKDFLQSVLDNPENHLIRDTYFPHLNAKS